MFSEIWSNRTNICNHFSNKLTSINQSLGISTYLGWLILVLIGLLLVYTLIRYYEWSRRNLDSQIQPNIPLPNGIEAFTPDDWPNKSNSESAGTGQQIVNYIQPGDYQCANLENYLSSEYLIYMNKPNIQARGFDTLAELTDKYRQGVCQVISNDEQQATTKWIVTEMSGLRNHIWRQVAEKWLSASYLCKAQPWLEGGMPHTHGRAILMRPDWFRTPENLIGDTTKIGILWHEMTHIWQRFQPEDFTKLYHEWGFEPITAIPAGLETVLLRSRLNPDALPTPSSPIWVWHPQKINTNAGINNPGPFWIDAVYPTVTPTSLHDIQFMAYSLASGGTRYLGQQPMELSKLREFAGFFGSGRNHYHPNELAAHYMDELFTGRMDLSVSACKIFADWIARV